ncbi:hypothetical protein [Corynebacterium variabile]|uniref:hypothetical protein n=1 Tax=Corynebacterium variabile TaxID=1727 RepID=UPI0028A2AEEC|nr:hypothetical protein [Corynebacterium variabile]
MILPVIFHGKDGPAAAAMLDRWTPAFTHSVPAVVRETAQDLADVLVDVALHRLTGASHFGPLKEHFGTAVHYPDGARVRKHREIDEVLLNGMILTLDEELQAVWVQCLVRALTENGSKPLTKTTWNLLLDSVGPIIVDALSDYLLFMNPEAPVREAEVDIRIDPKSRILPTGPTTAVTWIGDVRGRRTVALDPWWDRGDSLLLDEASRGALIGAAKATVAALARLTTRDHALLRVGLPEVTRRGPTNVLPLARDSAVIECPLRVFDAEVPREIVLFHVPDHHTARELRYALAGPVDTIHALWAPALAAAAQAHDAAHGEPPWMEKVVNASLRDYAGVEG